MERTEEHPALPPAGRTGDDTSRRHHEGAAPRPPGRVVAFLGRDATSVVVRLDGELDIETAPELDAVVTAVAARHPGADVRLDVSGLRSCDVRGVAALEAARRTVQGAGGRLRVAGASAFLREVARLCRAGDLLAVTA